MTTDREWATRIIERWGDGSSPKCRYADYVTACKAVGREPLPYPPKGRKMKPAIDFKARAAGDA